MTLLACLCLLAGEDPGILESLRERVAPSVVAIEVDRESDPEGTGGAGQVAAHRDYYNRPKGPASGLIYEADGFILTTCFNVSGAIRKDGLHVRLSDGRRLPAALLGFDQARDIALLKVEAEGLPVLPKADFQSLGAGTFVAAVGRAPDPEHPTIGVGILSALHRMKDTAVQCDAETNYGNAGGALVTLRGELVGLVNHIRPRTVWGQSSGVGFACKTAEIDAVLERLKKGERIEAPKRAFLGIRPGEGNPDVEGVEVGGAFPGSPAEKAGFQPGDVIVEIDGVKTPDLEALKTVLAEKKVGDEVTLMVVRQKAAPIPLVAKLEGTVDE